MRARCIDKDDGAEESEDEEKEGESEDDDGFFPGREVGVLFFGIFLGITWEEY